jgi:glycogen operon protein
MFLNGEEIATPGPHGERIVDDSFIALFNANGDGRTFTLPNRRFGQRWELELSTADPALEPGAFSVEAQGKVELVGRALVLFRRAA